MALISVSGNGCIAYKSQKFLYCRNDDLYASFVASCIDCSIRYCTRFVIHVGTFRAMSLLCSHSNGLSCCFPVCCGVGYMSVSYNYSGCCLFGCLCGLFAIGFVGCFTWEMLGVGKVLVADHSRFVLHYKLP